MWSYLFFCRCCRKSEFPTEHQDHSFGGWWGIYAKCHSGPLLGPAPPERLSRVWRLEWPHITAFRQSSVLQSLLFSPRLLGGSNVVICSARTPSVLRQQTWSWNSRIKPDPFLWMWQPLYSGVLLLFEMYFLTVKSVGVSGSSEGQSAHCEIFSDVSLVGIDLTWRFPVQVLMRISQRERRIIIYWWACIRNHSTSFSEFAALCLLWMNVCLSWKGVTSCPS